MPDNLNVFSGNTALRDFHNPEKQPYIPLVELPESLNPFHSKGVRVYAKLMNLLPLNNVKSVPAYNMLEQAQKRGTLNGVDTLVEASSGNTALSLAAMAPLFGLKETRTFIAHEISPGKLKLLQLFGAISEVFEEPICADPADPESRLYKAREFGQQKNVFNPDQYSNPDNPASHSKITGRQIWEQTGGNILIFATGLGTTGTLIGISKYLKEQNANVQVIAGIRKPNNLIPGLRTLNLLKEIEHPWQEYTDSTELVGSVESYTLSLQMIRHGLFVGPSSGLSLAALFNFLEKQQVRS